MCQNVQKMSHTSNRNETNYLQFGNPNNIMNTAWVWSEVTNTVTHFPHAGTYRTTSGTKYYPPNPNPDCLRQGLKYLVKKVLFVDTVKSDVEAMRKIT